MELLICTIVIIIAIWWFRRPRKVDMVDLIIAEKTEQMEKLVLDYIETSRDDVDDIGLYESIVTNADDVLDKDRGEITRKKTRKNKVHHGHFRNYLVGQARAKFGQMDDNKANRLVVRNFVYNLCVENRLTTRHMNDHIDIATSLVFVPTDEYLTSLAYKLTAPVRIRNEVRRRIDDMPTHVA
jgi:hypothetical protein